MGTPWDRTLGSGDAGASMKKRSGPFGSNGTPPRAVRARPTSVSSLPVAIYFLIRRHKVSTRPTGWTWPKRFAARGGASTATRSASCPHLLPGPPRDGRQAAGAAPREAGRRGRVRLLPRRGDGELVDRVRHRRPRADRLRLLRAPPRGAPTSRATTRTSRSPTTRPWRPIGASSSATPAHAARTHRRACSATSTFLDLLYPVWTASSS